MARSESPLKTKEEIMAAIQAKQDEQNTRAKKEKKDKKEKKEKKEKKRKRSPTPIPARQPEPPLPAMQTLG